jgi:hypothetical protein
MKKKFHYCPTDLGFMFLAGLRELFRLRLCSVELALRVGYRVSL